MYYNMTENIVDTAVHSSLLDTKLDLEMFKTLVAYIVFYPKTSFSRKGK